MHPCENDEHQTASGSPMERQRGMALLVVLWVVAVAALMVSAFNAIARSGATFAASEVQLSRNEALLEAGVEIAASELLGKSGQRGWQPDGRMRIVSYGGVDLSIAVRDPNGLIDLNQADGKILASLFRSQGMSEDAANKLRDAILEARGESTPGKDKDRQRPAAPATKPAASNVGLGQPASSAGTSPRAAVAADGAAEGVEGGTAKSPAMVFVDRDQLRQMKGMTLQLYRTLAPLVTVYSQDGRINLASAPDGVLAAVPNVSRIDVARVRDAARAGVSSESALADIKQRAGGVISDEAGPAYVVTVKLASGGRYLAAREFVIAVGLDEDAPYRLIAKKAIALSN